MMTLARWIVGFAAMVIWCGALVFVVLADACDHAAEWCRKQSLKGDPIKRAGRWLSDALDRVAKDDRRD
jgi:hypothetical protein